MLDPKGELLRDTGHLLKEHGYDIKVLDLINMEKSHCYNPFVYLQSDDDIQRLTTNLFKNTTPKGSQTQDPFWDQTAAMLLKALVCYLHYEAPPDEQNFPMVMEMIRAGDVKENNEDYLSVLDELFERLEAKNPEHIALKYYRAYHSGSAKTLKSIQISLVSRLEKFNLDSLAGITQTDEMDLGEIGERKTAVLVDHAWGIEPVTMADIKSYKSDGHSLSNGQVLSRPYKYHEARLVFREMIEVLCTDMFSKNLVTQGCSWWVSYDYKSLEVCPSYDGPLSMDFYGRIHPKHSNGTVKLPTVTNNIQIITAPLLKSFDDKTDHRLLYRRLGVCANDVKEDSGVFQLNMFIDYEALERDRKLQGAMLEVRRKFGSNALFKGMNLMEGATTLERNQQIGGHKA